MIQRRSSERRRAARQKSLLSGRIHFNNRRSTLDCLIRDISPTGARLIFSEAVNVPDVIELYIPQKEQTLRARVHWRHGDEVGIAFAAAADAQSPAEASLAARVEKLEAEMAAMRKLLKRLKLELGTDEAA
jgi:hypothetical protein